MHIKLYKKKGIFITIIIEKHQLAFYHNEMRQKLVCRRLQVLWSSMDVFGEKLKGTIVERSRGLTLWIRFVGLSLCCLLEGVETCYRGEFAKRFVKSWEDGGRKFRLECRANETSRFIHALWLTREEEVLFSVPGGERPSGRLGHVGWKAPFSWINDTWIAQGVLDSIRTKSRVGATEGKTKESFTEVVKSRVRWLGEAMWL